MQNVINLLKFQISNFNDFPSREAERLKYLTKRLEETKKEIEESERSLEYESRCKREYQEHLDKLIAEYGDQEADEPIVKEFMSN